MKSAIAVSMHKAGSSVTDLILTDMTRAAGYETELISPQVPASPLNEPDFFHAYAERIRPEGGIYYGMARHYGAHDMPILHDLRLIAQMRDPRDCLTSGFFSFGGAHQAPADPGKRAEFMARRDQINAMDIDRYVIENAQNYLMRCEKIRQLVETHPDLLLLEYADMVDRTQEWLDKIADFLDLEIAEWLQAICDKRLDFDVEKEDPSKHKRQVRPGDYRRKLKPGTIEQVNKVLAPALEYFDYAA